MKEAYKTFKINDKRVFCYDESDGFTLEIGEKSYYVYYDNGTQVELVSDGSRGGREYVGKISDEWTGDEKEAAAKILGNP